MGEGVVKEGHEGEGRWGVRRGCNGRWVEKGRYLRKVRSGKEGAV